MLEEFLRKVSSFWHGIVHTILQCLLHVSEKKYYGITTLVDVLRGAQSKKIFEAGLNRIPEYGSLKGVSREELTAIVEWLVENHYILKTKGMYPVLHPTYDGMHYDEKITTNQLRKPADYLTKKG